MEIAAGTLTRRQLIVLGRADDQELELAARSETAEGGRESGLVLVILDRLQSAACDGVLGKEKGKDPSL